MGLSGIFKESGYKKEIADLMEKVADLEKNYKKELAESTAKISDLEKLIAPVGIEKLQSIAKVNEQLSSAESELEKQNILLESQKKLCDNLKSEISQKKNQIVCLDDEILVQSFGLYQPRFAFASSTDYKEVLAETRNAERILIKNGSAVTGNPKMTLNNDLKKGQRMIKDIQKLLLRAFNSECDDLVDKVKYTNYDATLKKLYSSAEQISKLGAYLGISITQPYITLKVKELRLSFEYQLKKQEEKERLRELRAQERETAKLQRELDEQRRKIEKEQTHYQTAFQKLQEQLILHPDDTDLLSKKEEMEEHLSDIDKALNNIDYREANMKAGYVYIISNIGAFGENVYKIGMTRRLDPQDRIDELGDASVPFNFDVHAMIFSDDAPALETALHKAFENRKLNLVNQRREFFNVTLDEIKEVVKANFDKTVEFTDVPDAEQYRISQKMRQQYV